MLHRSGTCNKRYTIMRNTHLYISVYYTYHREKQPIYSCRVTVIHSYRSIVYLYVVIPEQTYTRNFVYFWFPSDLKIQCVPIIHGDVKYMKNIQTPCIYMHNVRTVYIYAYNLGVIQVRIRLQ